MADTKKCAHPSCNCMARNGDKYCSQYCHDAGSTMELSCNCGHAGCSLEANVSSNPTTTVGVE